MPINTIDEVLNGKIPSLIKIDVEGYETLVLKGADKTLLNPTLKAIIIELNGSGGRYGFDEKIIHQNFINLGFKPYSYIPFDRKLVEKSTFGDYNTIYIRDLDFVNQRIFSAEIITINQTNL